ncbi:hypothetical protein F442_19661 [Phytophthora nicotianae P10297]|uniref:Carbohydrate binding module family 25 domain-containing protein n=1 Tax=Phytophthora nicotianae P10297 TaxID=1317064 RepID=W2Y8S0_PHYNI|nr:hypothetical protein F442_19661 [Phytophthora nicotianae P10297]
MTSSRVEITFNDGNDVWDNNINDNYACTPPGSDCVEIVDKNSKILRFQQVLKTNAVYPTTTTVRALNDAIVLQRRKARCPSHEFVFNNGVGVVWDNNNANYKVSSVGTYSVVSKVSGLKTGDLVLRNSKIHTQPVQVNTLSNPATKLSHRPGQCW